jgi:hypothetical protein
MQLFGCARCLQGSRTYDTTYASVLVLSRGDNADDMQQMHETACKKARGNLNSYCSTCRVMTANVDSTQSGTENVLEFQQRSAQFTQYEAFASRMPCKRTLSKRMHLTSTLKSKARKRHVPPADEGPSDAPSAATLRET